MGKVKYAVVEGTSPENLQQRVRDMVEAGLVPHGAPFVFKDKLVQAMTLGVRGSSAEGH